MKKRLDILLTEQGFFDSREKAKEAIRAGDVFVNGKKAEKVGAQTDGDSVLEVHAASVRYVSRGGYKLEKAIRVFSVDLQGITAMDIGASTGGFTDCMLQNGAKRVYAVDVGSGQLSQKLLDDERVINLERTNMRYLTCEQIPQPVDFFSADVSFISLKLILPAARAVCRDGARAVCLIKPQFEAGREAIGKNGVVKDKRTHIRVVNEIILFCLANGFCVLGLDYSPVKGPQGNIEYLIYLEKSDSPVNRLTTDVSACVERSHRELDG